jgi:hypothetical protein
VISLLVTVVEKEGFSTPYQPKDDFLAKMAAYNYTYA